MVSKIAQCPCWFLVYACTFCCSLPENILSLTPNSTSLTQKCIHFIQSTFIKVDTQPFPSKDILQRQQTTINTILLYIRDNIVWTAKGVIYVLGLRKRTYTIHSLNTRRIKLGQFCKEIIIRGKLSCIVFASENGLTSPLKVHGPIYSNKLIALNHFKMAEIFSSYESWKCVQGGDLCRILTELMKGESNGHETKMNFFYL